MNNNALITALTFLGGVVILAIVALAIWGPIDNTIIANATGQIVTVVTLITGMLVTFKVTSEAKAAAVESKAVAQKAVAAAVDSKVVSEQNAAALEEVHGLVNGTKTGLEKEIAALHSTLEIQSKALASVEKALAVERAIKGPAKTGDQH